MFSISTLCTVCALSFIAVPPKGEGSSDEGGKCPITGLLTSSKTKAAEAAVPAEVGKVAPPFELMDTNGKAHKLSDFKGKTVVLEWFCSLPVFRARHLAVRCTPLERSRSSWKI